jgi:hypothetical protein
LEVASALVASPALPLCDSASSTARVDSAAAVAVVAARVGAAAPVGEASTGARRAEGGEWNLPRFRFDGVLVGGLYLGDDREFTAYEHAKEKPIILHVLGSHLVSHERTLTHIARALQQAGHSRIVCQIDFGHNTHYGVVGINCFTVPRFVGFNCFTVPRKNANSPSNAKDGEKESTPANPASAGKKVAEEEGNAALQWAPWKRDMECCSVLVPDRTIPNAHIHAEQHPGGDFYCSSFRGMYHAKDLADLTQWVLGLFASANANANEKPASKAEVEASRSPPPKEQTIAV